MLFFETTIRKSTITQTEHRRSVDRAQTFHGHRMGVPQTQHGRSADTALTFCCSLRSNSPESATEFHAERWNVRERSSTAAALTISWLYTGGKFRMASWATLCVRSPSDISVRTSGDCWPPWPWPSQWHGHGEFHVLPGKTESGFRLSGLFCAPLICGSVFLQSGQCTFLGRIPPEPGGQEPPWCITNWLSRQVTGIPPQYPATVELLSQTVHLSTCFHNLTIAHLFIYSPPPFSYALIYFLFQLCTYK